MRKLGVANVLVDPYLLTRDPAEDFDHRAVRAGELPGTSSIASYSATATSGRRARVAIEVGYRAHGRRASISLR